MGHHLCALVGSIFSSTCFCRLCYESLKFLDHSDVLGHENANDNGEDTQRGGEDLNDQNLDEQAAVVGIRNGAGGADNSDGHTAGEVTPADSHTSGEEGVSSGHDLVDVLAVGAQGVDSGFHLTAEDDGQNDTVDSDGLAENDGDEVLAADLGGADSTTGDGAAAGEDTPAGTDDAQGKGHAAAHTSESEG